MTLSCVLQMDLTATQEDLRVTNARLKAAEKEHAAVGQELQVGLSSRACEGDLQLAQQLWPVGGPT